MSEEESIRWRRWKTASSGNVTRSELQKDRSCRNMGSVPPEQGSIIEDIECSEGSVGRPPSKDDIVALATHWNLSGGGSKTRGLDPPMVSVGKGKEAAPVPSRKPKDVELHVPVLGLSGDKKELPAVLQNFVPSAPPSLKPGSNPPSAVPTLKPEPIHNGDDDLGPSMPPKSSIQEGSSFANVVQGLGRTAWQNRKESQDLLLEHIPSNKEDGCVIIPEEAIDQIDEAWGTV